MKPELCILVLAISFIVYLKAWCEIQILIESFVKALQMKIKTIRIEKKWLSHQIFILYFCFLVLNIIHIMNGCVEHWSH